MIKNLANSITLEPPLALMGFGEGQIFAGGQIQHDLLLWKMHANKTKKSVVKNLESHH